MQMTQFDIPLLCAKWCAWTYMWALCQKPDFNVTYRKFEWFTMCEFSQKIKTFCLNMCTTKFWTGLQASHLKFHIN
jgi:hypothetical protein